MNGGNGYGMCMCARAQTACDSLLALAEEKQERIEAVCSDELMGSAETTLLMQALMKVLDNALRHAPAGNVVTGNAAAAGVVTIAVRDEGPGIAAEHHERLFQRFSRVEPPRARASGVAGLGLSIAETAVMWIKGRITVASQAGQGAPFRFELPAAQPAGQPDRIVRKRCGARPVALPCAHGNQEPRSRAMRTYNEKDRVAAGLAVKAMLRHAARTDVQNCWPPYE